jgi:hypothetical protein
MCSQYGVLVGCSSSDQSAAAVGVEFDPEVAIAIQQRELGEMGSAVWEVRESDGK